MADADLYLFGTAQLPAPAGATADETMLYTDEELHAFLDALMDGDEEGLPAVWQHAGGELGDRSAFGADGLFHAPPERTIGRLVHGMVDKQKRLMLTTRLDGKAPETAEIRARLERGEPIGYSMGTNMLKGFGVVKNKKFDHIGITDDPAYGAPITRDAVTGLPASTGTYIHVAALSPEGFLNQMRPYLTEPGMYIPQRIRQRFAGADGAIKQAPLLSPQTRAAVPVSIGASNMSDTTPVTQPPATQQPPAPVAQPAPAQPAAPTLSGEQAERELLALSAQVMAVYKDEPTKLSYEDHVRAMSFYQQHENVMKRAGISLLNIPNESKRAMSRLIDILDIYKQYGRKAIEQDQPTEEARNEVVANMDKRFVANSVFASATKIRDEENRAMLNAKEQEEKLRAEVVERKAAEAEAARKTAADAMEVERTTLTKRMRDLEDALLAAQGQQPPKRQRTEPAVPAGGAAPAETGGLTAVSVGASRSVGTALSIFGRAPSDKFNVLEDPYMRGFLPKPGDKHWAGGYEFTAPDKVPITDPFGAMYKNVSALLHQHFHNPDTAICCIDPVASEMGKVKENA